MKIRKVKDLAREFCRKHISVSVIQVLVYDSVGLVKDIGEFQITGHHELAWEPKTRVHGVAEWLADRRSWASCELVAMDQEWTRVSQVKFELCGDRARQGPDLNSYTCPKCGNDCSGECHSFSSGWENW